MKQQLHYWWLKFLYFLYKTPLQFYYALSGLLLVIGAYFFWFSWYLPLQEEKTKTEQEIVSLMAVQDALEKKNTALRQIQAETQSLANRSDTILQETCSAHDACTNFLQYAEGSQLRVHAFEKKDPRQTDLFSKHGLHLHIEGSFQDLSTFLSIIQQDASLHRLKELSIKRKDEGDLDIRLRCNFYQKRIAS